LNKWERERERERKREMQEGEGEVEVSYASSRTHARYSRCKIQLQDFLN